MNESPSMIILAGSLFGVMVILGTLYNAFQVGKARKWPSTQGRVLKSEERWKEAEGMDRDGGMGVGNFPMVEFEYEAFKELGWPEVSGKIISSKVDISREYVTVNSTMKNLNGAIMTVYRPMVVYRYKVDGVWHESSRITTGVGMRDTAMAPVQKIVRLYPAGSGITVRYNPKNAAESILKTSLGGLFLGLILGAALLAVAVAMSGYLHRYV